MDLAIVAHAGWDELLVAALAVLFVVIVRTRSERRRRLEEEADAPVETPVEERR